MNELEFKVLIRVHIIQQIESMRVYLCDPHEILTPSQVCAIYMYAMAIDLQEECNIHGIALMMTKLGGFHNTTCFYQAWFTFPRTPRYPIDIDYSNLEQCKRKLKSIVRNLPFNSELDVYEQVYSPERYYSRVLQTHIPQGKALIPARNQFAFIWLARLDHIPELFETMRDIQTLMKRLARLANNKARTSDLAWAKEEVINVETATQVQDGKVIVVDIQLAAEVNFYFRIAKVLLLEKMDWLVPDVFHTLSQFKE